LRSSSSSVSPTLNGALDRRGPALKLALALQIGFLRMTGRRREAVRIVPPALWRHLGEQLGIVRLTWHR
jgi:hypothetical protein